MPHNFWMINCNELNYNVTRQLGFTKQGLKSEYRRKVQRVEPGDRVIYYVTGSRVFTATATVTRGYEEVDDGPWFKEGKATWPYRIEIKPDVVLSDEQHIDAGMLAYRLEYVRKWAPENWHMAFQGNLHLLSKNDFFLLESEMLKLRDGREKGIEQIEAALAAEEERANAQRERRRRSAANRPPPRPPQPREGSAQEAPAREAPAREPSSQPNTRRNEPQPRPRGQEPPQPQSQDDSAEQAKSPGRPRRSQRSRGANRNGSARRQPQHDNE